LRVLFLLKAHYFEMKKPSSIAFPKSAVRVSKTDVLTQKLRLAGIWN
jgi:hypothetical protein